MTQIRSDTGRGGNTIRRYRRVYAFAETLVRVHHTSQPYFEQHGLIRDGVRHAEERVRPGRAKRHVRRGVQRLVDPVGLFHAVRGRRRGTGPVGRREKNPRSPRRRLRVRQHQGRVQESEGRTPQGKGRRDLWPSTLTRLIVQQSDVKTFAVDFFFFFGISPAAVLAICMPLTKCFLPVDIIKST